MKFLVKILSFLALFWITFLNAFAIDTPINLKTDSIVDNSINLSWDSVDNAYMYYVSYWKTSWWPYENQTDFVDTNNISIEWLESWNTYYFVVTALDEDGNESTYSNEVAEDINIKVFGLDTINVIYKNKIELVFSDNLDSTDWTEREFNIYNKSDELDTYDVISTELNSEDNHKLELTLDRDIEVWVEYEVVVIAIKNESLQNIESGIDSIETFTLTEELVNSFTWTLTETLTWDLLDNTSTWEVLVNENTTNQDLNSAWDEGSIAWANVDESDLENTTLWAAQNNTSLPKTWPEHILIFVLSVILAWLFFVFKYKKI